MAPVVEVRKLVKVYRNGTVALDGVSLEIERGEIFAILGLNGAGKTTLTKIILGLLKPTAGEVFIFGKPASQGEWRKKIGYLPESFQAPANWKVKDVLEFLGALSGLSSSHLKNEISSILEIVDLSDARNKKVKELSKGMLTRLGLAQALIHKPEILFLDEPTEGLDPIGRRKTRELLVKLRNNGVSILLNSHLLSEIELIADRIGILHKGKLLAYGKLKEIMPKDEKYIVEVYLKTQNLEDFKSEIANFSYTQNNLTIQITASGMNELEKILNMCKKYSVDVVSISPMRTSLEDVFISYIKSGE